MFSETEVRVKKNVGKYQNYFMIIFAVVGRFFCCKKKKEAEVGIFSLRN